MGGEELIVSLKPKILIKQLAIALITGSLAGFLTRDDVKIYMETAEKPFFSPPGWLFPIVWTILYALMGIAAYLVDSNTEPKNALQRKRSLILYYIQLFFNFAWSFIFFSFGQYLFAFIWIIVLWILILLTIVSFHSVNKTASYLLIPYLIWVAFAAVLNFSIYLLN